MKTMQKELFIQAEKYSWEDKFSIGINTYERKSDNSEIAITLDKVTVNVEVPELDEKMLTLAQIEQTQEQIKAEKAASYLRVTKMEDHINSLMCLENNGEQ